MENILEYFKPRQSVDVILDTDTFNEIDDQFAIAYMLKYSDRINVKGITIAPFAPFWNKKVKDINEGIDASFDTAINVLRMSKREDLYDSVYHGARKFMDNETTPVESDACDFIIKESLNYNKDNRLWVVAIGAITNVASAIVKDPSIIDRIALIWLGGSDYNWYQNREFNMYQDIAAARVAMGANIPFAQLPCQGVVSAFTTTKYELSHYLLGKNELADTLTKWVIEYMDQGLINKYPCWSKPIWDVCAIAFLVNDGEQFMKVVTKNVKLPNYDAKTYGEELDKKIAYVCEIKRDALYNDLFTKLTK